MKIFASSTRIYTFNNVYTDRLSSLSRATNRGESVLCLVESKQQDDTSMKLSAQALRTSHTLSLVSVTNNGN